MKFFILISALSLVSGQEWGTTISQCVINRGPLPIVVEISGCSTPPCALNVDETTNFDILFRTPYSLNSLRTRATAMISIIPVNINLGVAGDTCSNLLSGRCPANEGALLLHRLGLYIDPGFPSISLPIEIVIEDENNVSVACFRVNVIVQQTQKLNASDVPKIE